MKHTLSLFFAALVCLLAACEHKPLLLPGDETARVNVEFDWSEVAPGDIPDNATLYFYSTTGDCIQKTLPTNQADQVVVLPYGVYQLLVTTGSEEYVTPHPGSIPTHSLSLDDNPGGIVGLILGSSASSYDEPTDYPSPIAHAIDPIYAYIIEHLELPEGTTTTTVVVKPRRVTARYNIIVNNFQVDKDLARIWGGAISGLNGTLLPGKTLFANHCCPAAINPIVTHPFLLDWDGTPTATATVYTFGTPTHPLTTQPQAPTTQPQAPTTQAHPSTTQPQTLTAQSQAPATQSQLLHLYVWSDKSSRLSLTYDITKIIAEAPDPMNVDIIINFNSQGGAPFTPGVTDFEEEEETIIM